MKVKPKMLFTVVVFVVGIILELGVMPWCLLNSKGVWAWVSGVGGVALTVIGGLMVFSELRKPPSDAEIGWLGFPKGDPPY